MKINDTQKIDEYYQALVDRSPEYLGIFFAGVKTTSIFCIPTCRARKPKPENVTFYSDFKDALDHGFRPCKICHPTQNAYQAPEMVTKALQLLQAQPKVKITDYQLVQAGIQPEKVRRWFKAHHGMTFQAYQRMFRINNAYQELKGGKSATDTAFDSGYESISGFTYTFKKLTGKAPSQAKTQALIYVSRLTTPLGPMFVGCTDEGLCLLEFVDRKMLETEFHDLQVRLKARIVRGNHPHIQQVEQELKEYFEGKRKVFTVPLAAPGTEFQKEAWQALHTIPYGSTVSYQTQAQKLGKPKAVRAVASANGNNRISIIIPCHRVIGKDGALRGYGGGIERKRWLLNLEKTHLKS